MKKYPVPLDAVPVGLTLSHQRLIDRYLGIGATAITADIRKAWNTITDKQLRVLADHVLSFAPTALVFRGEQAWVQLGKISQGVSEGFFVPFNHAKSIPNELFAGFSPDRDVCLLLKSFFECFGGLRETDPPLSGYFFDPPFPSLREIAERDDVNFGAWGDAIPVFQGLAGDTLLVDANGRTGWWLIEEQRVAPFLENLGLVLEKYVELKKSQLEYRLLDPYIMYDFIGISEF